MVFVFIAGGCWRYFKPKAFDKTLWKEMLRYCLPMIPASISFWIINASDMFFVQGMCEGYAGRSGNHWVGLLSAGYFLPQIITILGSIFYEAWQLSAVTEETDREAFFSKIFRVYASVLFWNSFPNVTALKCFSTRSMSVLSLISSNMIPVPAIAFSSKSITACDRFFPVLNILLYLRWCLWCCISFHCHTNEADS